MPNWQITLVCGHVRYAFRKPGKKESGKFYCIDCKTSQEVKTWEKK